MRKGTQLEIGKTYFIKSSTGNVYSVECTDKTHTSDVWQFGFISRHIRDIYRTEEAAAKSRKESVRS